MPNDIEELFLSAAEADDKSTVEQLLETLRSGEDIPENKLRDGMDLLAESWKEDIHNDQTKAEIILEMAKKHGALDTPAVRNALQKAFSKLKKTSLATSALLKATGVRTGATLPSAVERFETLNRLENGDIAFNSLTGRRGVVKEIDGMSYEMFIRWDGLPTDTVIPIDAALNDLAFIKNAPPANKPLKPAETAKRDYDDALRKLFVSPYDETTAMRFAAVSAIANGTEKAAFEAWWNENGGPRTSATSAKRPFTKARSLRELRDSLEHLNGKKPPEGWEKELAETLGKIKIGKNAGDAATLADSLATLADAAGTAETATAAETIKDKAAFWPENPDAPSKDAIDAWNALPAAKAKTLAELTVKMLSKDYLAKLLPKLEYKTLNAAAEHADSATLLETIGKTDAPNAPALLWIWRSQRDIPAEMMEKLTAANILKAIDKNPKNAGRELKKLILDDKSFQTDLMKRAEGAENAVIEAVEASKELQTDEKQSLLVKLAAISEPLKKLLQSGRGRKLFAAHAKTADAVAENSEKVTSIRSYAAKSAELENIVTKQIPENSKAIAHARSYGDLRENAEYKAAKERQAFLNRRRAEIERDLAEFRPVDFTNVEIDGVAIPGASVTLKFENGDSETYHLLGAWDGDPDKNQVSHISALGKVLDGTRKGDEISLPDKRSATIAEVAKISDDLAEDLAGHP